MVSIEQLMQQLQQLQLENQRLQQVLQQSSSTSRPPEPKVSLPAKFDGKRSQFRGFVNQVKLVFRLHSHWYLTVALQVGLVGTLLTGSALKWFAPLLEKDSTLLDSWNAFYQEFEAAFGDMDRERTASNKLR
ncbi:uncharacterized protein LOC112349847 [Selaginella moellendorffii]|uniref:uncharacterized protein LOC112349847 n=1 Tax=Selaginella moellendorffii TaxID=88036 RepID=UPI000D1C37F5|nr:uncharacterized protein LOC112349847 [Selaginella moellendorffii]|eukprot:XP_024540741.1 uncharacterized protein LOC112349847 [Selaginella moellendorffii]